MVGEIADVGPVSVNGSSPAAEPGKREPIPDDVRWDVWLRDDFRCRRCHIHRNLVIDHVVPVAEGGTNAPENLQTLCSSCNGHKSTTGWEQLIEKEAGCAIYCDHSTAELRQTARQVLYQFMTSDPTVIHGEFGLKSDLARVDVAFRLLERIRLEAKP